MRISLPSFRINVKLRLRHKILSIPLAMAFLMLAVGGFVWGQLQTVARLNQQTDSVVIPQVQIAARLMHNVLRRDAIVQQYLSRPETALLETIERNRVAAEDILRDATALPNSAADVELVTKVRSLHRQYVDMFLNQVVPAVQRATDLGDKMLNQTLGGIGDDLDEISARNVRTAAAAQAVKAARTSIGDFIQTPNQARADTARGTLDGLGEELDALAAKTKSTGGSVAQSTSTLSDIALDMALDFDTLVDAVRLARNLVDDKLPATSSALSDEALRLQGAATAALSQSSEDAGRGIARSVAVLWIGVLLALAIGGALALLVTRRIIEPVGKLGQVMTRVRKESDFSLRADGFFSKDEIGEMAAQFNALLDQLQAAISEVNHSVGAVTKGIFDQVVQAEMCGDLAELKDGVNRSAASVQFTMQALDAVMDSLLAGDFSQRMDADVQGESKHKVDAALGSLQATISEVSNIMDSVAQGDFSRRMAVDVAGDLALLKRHVNTSLTALDGAFGEIDHCVQKAAQGDLSRRVEGDYEGRIATTCDALNTALAQLGALVSEITIAARNVTHATREIAGGNMDLGSRTERQATHLASIHADMNELVEVVEANALSLEQSRKLADEAMQQTSQAAETGERAETAMTRIDESNHRIKEIVGLIDSIAFQTNLLALNAAVEAARAGEQGRGFAVVASEVRTLAGRSAQAAREIRELIEDSVTKVAEGNALVKDVGAAFREISEVIGKVDGIGKDIAQRGEEQSEGTKRVQGAVAKLDDMNQENSALVEELAATSDAMSEKAAGLQAHAERFKVS